MQKVIPSSFPAECPSDYPDNYCIFFSATPAHNLLCCCLYLREGQAGYGGAESFLKMMPSNRYCSPKYWGGGGGGPK